MPYPSRVALRHHFRLVPGQQPVLSTNGCRIQQLEDLAGLGAAAFDEFGPALSHHISICGRTRSTRRVSIVLGLDEQHTGAPDGTQTIFPCSTWLMSNRSVASCSSL